MNTEDKLISRFLNDHIDVALTTIEDHEPTQIASLLETLSTGESALILSKLPTFVAGKVLEKMNLNATASLFQHMQHEAGEAILRQLDKQSVEQILQNLPLKISNHYKMTLHYSKEKIGSICNATVPTLTPGKTVSEALKIIRKHGDGIKSQVFVLDGNKRLLGYIDLKDLIVHSDTELLEKLMKPIGQQALADMNISDLLENWDPRYDELPVVDANKRFLGTVSKTSLGSSLTDTRKIGTSTMKAGNALGDLYLIGLTGLFGSTSPSDHI